MDLKPHMTGDELRQWRMAKGLSHQDAADLLGASSRFVVIRWEKGGELPSSLAARITEAEATIAATPADQKPQGRSVIVKHDYSAHKCWTLSGRPITFDETQKRPIGFQFYRLDNTNDIDPVTDHLKANLYETTRKRRRGQATDFALDLVSWRITCLAYESDPYRAALLAELNALLQPRTTETTNVYETDFFAAT